MKPITEWTEEMAAAVSRIEVVRRNGAGGDSQSDTVIKLWFWNKNHALELLSRHLGVRQPATLEDQPLVPCYIVTDNTRVHTKVVPGPSEQN